MALGSVVPFSQNDEKNFVHPLRRGLMILDLLGADPNRYLGVNEIARLVDMHKSTVSRLCAELHDGGYLEREQVAGKFRLGPRIFQLAGTDSPDVDLRTVARPVLQSLVDATGDTAHLAILEEHTVVTVEVAESTNLIRAHPRIGMQQYIHASASALAVLSYLPRGDLHQYLGRGPLVRLTDQTITDRRQIARQLDVFAEQGYSVDMEGIEEGLRVVGAAFRGQSGNVIGSVAVSRPRHRLPDEAIAGLGRAVNDAAKQISTRLGAAPQWSVDVNADDPSTAGE